MLREAPSQGLVRCTYYVAVCGLVMSCRETAAAAHIERGEPGRVRGPRKHARSRRCAMAAAGGRPWRVGAAATYTGTATRNMTEVRCRVSRACRARAAARRARAPGVCAPGRLARAILL